MAMASEESHRGGFHRERAAMVLAEAALVGDARAAERWGVSTRTVERYRERLDDDEALSELVRQKKAAAESRWADRLGEAIVGSIDFLRRAAREADPTSPESIHAVAGGLKILTDVGMASRVLDERFARDSGPVDEVRGQVGAAGDEEARVH